MHPYPVKPSRLIMPDAIPASLLTDAITPKACGSDNHIAGSAYLFDAFHDSAYAYTWYASYGAADITPRGIGVQPFDVWNRPQGTPIYEGSGEGAVISAEWTLVPGACASVGGCLQGKVELSRKIDMPPRGSLKLFMNGIPVYLGRAVEEPKVSRSLVEGTSVETFTYNLEGWKVYANEVYLFGKTYERMKLSDVVKDVCCTFAGKTGLTFEPLNISENAYPVVQQEFDGVTVANALDSLTQLAGDYVWGVDTNGVIFWSKRNLEPSRLLWTGTRGIDIANLKSNYADLVTKIIVEAPTLKRENGRPARVTVEDPEAMELYGRTEEVIQYPFALLQEEIADIQSLNSSKSFSEGVDNDGNPLNEMVGAVVDDYLTFELSKPVRSFVFDQPSYDGTPSVDSLEVYDDANELLWAGEELQRLVPILFDEDVQTFRIVAKSAPKEGNWTFAPFDASIADMADCVRYAQEVLKLRNKPVVTGKLLEEPERFIAPEFAIKVTDTAGDTQIYEVESTTYTVRHGLESVSNIGRGAVNLARAVALQQRAQRLADLRSKEADRQLKAEIKEAKSTPYAIRLDDPETYTFPVAGEELWSFNVGRNMDMFAVSITSTDPAETLARLPVHRNGSEVGVITFPAKSNVGSLFWNLGRRFSAGDTLTVYAPDPQDLTLWGFVFQLRGDWVD
jgi:hypothetical protein